MDGRLVCLLVLLFLCGQLLSSNGQESSQPHQSKGIERHTLCTDGCICWKELDKKAEHCVRLCEDKEDRHDKTFCQTLENCRCDSTKGQHHLVCRKNGWSSEEIRYGCQEKKPGRSTLFSLISAPFRFLWYLLSQLVALFDWLLKSIFSVLQYLVSLVFKLLSWLFWLLEVLLSLAFSLMLYLGCIAAIGLACYLIYRYSHVQHVEEVVVHRRVVIERTIYL